LAEKLSITKTPRTPRKIRNLAFDFLGVLGDGFQSRLRRQQRYLYQKVSYQ